MIGWGMAIHGRKPALNTAWRSNFLEKVWMTPTNKTRMAKSGLTTKGFWLCPLTTQFLVTITIVSIPWDCGQLNHLWISTWNSLMMVTIWMQWLTEILLKTFPEFSTPMTIILEVRISIFYTLNICHQKWWCQLK